MQEEARRDFLGQRYSRRTGVRICVTLAVVITVLDILVGNRVNFSVFYILPLIVYAETAESRSAVRIALILLVLTYAGFLLKLYCEDRLSAGEIWSYRLLNRTLASGSVVVTAALLDSWMRFRSYWWERRAGYGGEPDSDEYLFEQIFGALQQLVGISICFVVIASVFIMDIMTPGQINAPILYFVPLVIAGLMPNRLVLWLVLALSLALSYVGWYWGPGPTLPQEFLPRLIQNRWLTAVALTGVALAMQLTMLRPPVQAGKSGHWRAQKDG